MEKSYRKTIYLTIIISLIIILIPNVLAKKPLRCEMEITFPWDPYQWEGTITGDINGEIVITPSMAIFPGATEHFLEIFEITTSDGVIIRGYDEGVWNFKTGKFRTNGVITEVIDESLELSYLVGYHIHIMGYTSTIIDGETPITGTASVRIY